MKKPLLFLILVLFVSRINAQWVTNGPSNAEITCLGISGSNIFAGAYIGRGVYLSTDNGGSWSVVNNGLKDTTVHSLAISGSNIFVSTEDSGVYLSTNNGGSWTPVNNGLATGASLAGASLFISGSNIFAGTYDSAYLSTNNGVGWTSVSNGLPTNSDVTSFAVSGSNIFAGTSNGVYLSTNNGGSWTSVSTGLPTNANVTSLAINGSNMFVGILWSGVYLSTNNGGSWTPVNNGLPTGTSLGGVSLFISGSNIFAGAIPDIYLSTDNGGNWAALNTGLPASTSTTSFVKSDSAIFAGTYGDGVWQTPLSNFTTGVKEILTTSQTDFKVYPNPAINQASFSYSITNESLLSLSIFDMLGDRVKTLLDNKNVSPGFYKIQPDLTNLPNGIYFCVLNVSGDTYSQKLIIQ